jgi:hypothetical protein
VYTSGGPAPTTQSTERSIVFESSTPGETRAQTQTFCSLDISDVDKNDIIWIRLERTGATDSYNSTLYIVDIEIEYVKWADGQFIV